MSVMLILVAILSSAKLANTPKAFANFSPRFERSENPGIPNTPQ